MKRVVVPILSFAVLAFAGLPVSAWADTVPADTAVVPADATTAAPVDQAAFAPAASAGPPGFTKDCQGPAGAAPAPGQSDTCNIRLRQGALSSNSQVTITLGSPQGSTITSCGGGTESSSTSCTYTFPFGTPFNAPIGSETFTISPSATPGMAISQGARVCRASSCSGGPLTITGSGAVVGGVIGPPPPPPPTPPFVTKFCSGPNNGGTVYAGQQDRCTVSAAPGDTFRQQNTITVTPASPAGVTVASCTGVAGKTVAVNNGAGNVAANPTPGFSCTYTVQSGAIINPGDPLGTELINIPATAISGSPIEQGVRWCSGGPEGICNAVPAQITATGPGGTVSTDPLMTAYGTAFSATEGQAFTGVVATFSDADPSASPSEYSATIDWGDGTTSPGTISGWSVSGSHTYLEEGAYGVTVTIRDPDTLYNSTHAFDSATVADGALAAQGKTINTTNPFSGTVATFTDADPNGAVADYSATIDWGDGTSSPGTIAVDGAAFDVNGTHAYALLGPYTVTVHVCDVGGACADANSAILVYALTTGGNFVIGDGNAALGSAVTFWGAQWASANTVSGGGAPADFKGFADNPNAAPSCGTNWATAPGNSSNPPADVPSYTAVIVSSSVSRERGRPSGDSTEVVIVRTDPGYAPDPGHAGTGTVVAVLCP